MNSNFSAPQENKGCAQFEMQIALYAMDELEGAEKDALEEHLDNCTLCVAALESERQMLEQMAQRESPRVTAALLSSCRSRFEDSLDELDHRGFWKRWSESLFPAHWLALYPVASVAALLLIGFSVGTLIPWRVQIRNVASPQTAATLSGMGLNAQELQSANVSGINWTPAENNQPARVEVQLTTQKPMVVQGTVNDDEVKRVLLYVLRNNRRFCPDIRINAVELLRDHANDPSVQQALAQAVKTDSNPSVRLSALSALSQAQPDQATVQAMLAALVKDSNIGVRVEAVNSLRRLSGNRALAADPQALETLRRQMRTDSNAYIRMQSAAALQQWSSQGNQ